jgi:ATP-dependent DNA helicase RecQ
MSGRYPGAQDVQALYRTLQREPADAEGGWSLPALKTALDLPSGKLRVAISMLRRQGIAAANPRGQIHLLKPQLDASALQQLAHAYESRREQDRAALEGMVAYAQTGQCRWQVLLRHLQEGDEAVACAHCDNCRRIAALQAELAERDAVSCPPGEGDGEAVGPGSPVASFRPDDAVQVRRYGRGRVVSADALSVLVEFPGGTQRSFLADYVQPVALRRSLRKSIEIRPEATPTGRHQLLNS